MSAETRLTAVDTRAGEDDPQSHDRASLLVYVGDGEQTHTEVHDIPDRGTLTIGRSRSAAITIDSDRISRIHARVSRRGAVLTVEDAGSRNGTRVNGELIDGPVQLRAGDEIHIGGATIIATVQRRVVRPDRVGSSRDLDDRLEMEADRGRRYRRACTLVMLRFGEVGDDEGLDAALDRVIALLRPMDTIAEYAPNEYGVVAPEIDAARAPELASRLARAAAEVRADVAVGFASIPEHGTAPAELIGRVWDDDAEPETGAGDAPVVGDPQMHRVFELVDKVARHSITVLINGETGVGKEVVASAIHQRSPRAAGPFVRLNCASLPETLLESQLFGHERGAFTGAGERKSGFFEAADGGTLFLDEIGETSAGTQAKLLRVLENKHIIRVGGTRSLAVDVRVVCATNRDLAAEVRRGVFREDLFFRVSGFTIVVPPLRDRVSEILPLAEHFARLAWRGRPGPVPGFSEAAREALAAYSWPGNVRELRNAVERALVVHTGGVIEPEDLPDRVRGQNVAAAGQVNRLEDAERSAIIAALNACDGNQTQAAKRLGITRRALIYRMEQHGLKPLPKSRRK